jgi:hypothetical protein
MSEPGATLGEMTGAVWTAIGLLAATSLGTLFYLGSKIDSLGSDWTAGSMRLGRASTPGSTHRAPSYPPGSMLRRRRSASSGPISGAGSTP